MSKEIEKRWKERVIPNGWDLCKDGADLYLKKYGKGISKEKMIALKEFAEEKGCSSFSLGMEEAIKKLGCHYIEYTKEEEIEEKFNSDVYDEFMMYKEEGISCKCIETTIGYLAGIKCGTICGFSGNSAFTKAAKKYKDIKIRACYNEEENNVGSCDIKIKNMKMGEDIEKLVYECGGSLRYDCCHGKGWEYFESE